MPVTVTAQTVSVQEQIAPQLSVTTQAKEPSAPVVLATATLSVVDKVKLSAAKHGIDQSLALNIACAESQFNPTVKNRRSSAGGVYQWLTSSWNTYSLQVWGTTKGHSKLNADDNIELSMYVLQNVGTKDWNASKWGGLGGGWKKKPFENGYCHRALA